MYQRIIALFLIVCVFLTGSILAQDDTEPIDYGETVTGEVTDDRFAVPYTFTGAAGDVVVMTIDGDQDAPTILFDPALILVSPDGEALADTTAGEGLFASVAVVELPEDGDYTLFATRFDGEMGFGFGGYTMSLFLAEPISADETTEGTITDAGANQYYVIQHDKDFALRYTSDTDANFPRLTVNALTDTGALEIVAEVYGSLLNNALFGPFPGGDTYIVTVGAGEFNRPMEPVEANFSIALEETDFE